MLVKLFVLAISLLCGTYLLPSMVTVGLTWGERSDLWAFVYWLASAIGWAEENGSSFAFWMYTGRVEKTLLMLGKREKPRGRSQHARTLETWNGHCELPVSNSCKLLDSQVAAQAFPFQPGSSTSRFWGGLSSWGVTPSLLSSCTLKYLV